MSSFSPTAGDRQWVRVGSADGLAELMLFDSRLNPVARGFGALEKEVPPGLYLARAIYGNQVEDKPLEVLREREGKHVFDPLEMHSPIPMSKNAYGELFSIRTQGEGGPRSSLGELVLCVTFDAPDKGRDRKIGRVDLLSADGSLLGPMRGWQLTYATARQACVWSEALLEPGGYFIVFNAPERVLPITVRADCRHDFYLSHVDGALEFLDASLVVQRRSGAAAKSEDRHKDLVLLEVIRRAILRGGSLAWRDSPPIERILRSTRRNPIVGVLAAHLLLRLRKESHVESTDVVGKILTVASEALGGLWHPDVWALDAKLRVLRHDDAPPIRYPSDVPPQLLLSWAYVLEAADTWPGCVSERLVTRTARVLSRRTLWTSFVNTQQYGLPSGKLVEDSFERAKLAFPHPGHASVLRLARNGLQAAIDASHDLDAAVRPREREDDFLKRIVSEVRSANPGGKPLDDDMTRTIARAFSLTVYGLAEMLGERTIERDATALFPGDDRSSRYTVYLAFGAATDADRTAAATWLAERLIEAGVGTVDAVPAEASMAVGNVLKVVLDSDEVRGLARVISSTINLDPQSRVGVFISPDNSGPAIAVANGSVDQIADAIRHVVRSSDIKTLGATYQKDVDDGDLSL